MDNQLETDSLKRGKFIKSIIGLLLVAVFFVGLALFLINREQKIDYTIPGVPYNSIWNHRGEGAVLSGETAAAVLSVMDYWEPGLTKPAEIDKFFRIERSMADNSAKDSGALNIGNVKKYLTLAAEDQYVVESVVLKPNEIKRYINPESKTPLLVYLPVSAEQPLELAYYPVLVVIGVNEPEEKIIAHGFWLGNNREISFDELNKLWERVRPEKRNQYLVIQPKNLKEKIAEISSREIGAYPVRSSLMVKNEAMIKDYILGMAAHTALNYNLAYDFFSKIEKAPGFQSDFIPVLRVQVLARIAAIKMAANDLPNALKYATQAVELNHDIDKPLDNGWPGYEHIRVNEAYRGVSSDPYRVLGNVYKAMGENEKAIEAYKKALEIDSTLQAVSQSLKELQK